MKKPILPVIEKVEEIKEIQVPEKAITISNVPFTSQSPFGNWKNIIYEEGCEEASITMAVYWARGIELTPEKADSEIKNISNFEAKIYGHFLDTSVEDTANIIKEYFSFNQYRIIENITKADIIKSISNGNLLLIPAYGRDLKNIFYTPPGPIAHMLVVVGYDPLTKEFITNDPGTKNGKDFRYNEDIFYNAIWAYPTNSGDLSPPDSTTNRIKTMIEVYK
ncbi:MAG: C39 family peptidase [Candidatus Gracilibacteria bacterium]|nr:C39 family peptidase [Candidatus Gracilibacteria bacterium]MDD2908421.1 C39 family peptidase [Candidatus Gracilibacteria bacterium]